MGLAFVIITKETKWILLVIELDGSKGEGGGQILRSSLTVALLTRKSFHLRNIRAGRPKPGLMPQHLMCVKSAATVGQAHVRGDSPGCRDVVFDPGEIIPGTYRFDIGTAGCTSLLLHTLYLPLSWQANALSSVTLRGGTHVKGGPSHDFLECTWRPYLELLGLEVRLELYNRGFYPAGGGAIEAQILPCAQIRGLQFEGSALPSGATVVSAEADLPRQAAVANRQANRAVAGLQKLGLAIKVEKQRWAGGPASVVYAVLHTEPVPTLFFALGAKGRPAERVADDLVEQVAQHLGQGMHFVDSHSADQLVLPLALASEPSRFHVAEVTSHLLTNIEVIRQFVDRSIICEGREGEGGVVVIS